ncbi:MAG: hypothetical protein MJZ42_05380 [Bacteroidales bacterium]|nr:hypothetical protein [Bacteroidales bacterium]
MKMRGEQMSMVQAVFYAVVLSVIGSQLPDVFECGVMSEAAFRGIGSLLFFSSYFWDEWSQNGMVGKKWEGLELFGWVSYVIQASVIKSVLPFVIFGVIGTLLITIELVLQIKYGEGKQERVWLFENILWIGGLIISIWWVPWILIVLSTSFVICGMLWIRR